MKKIVLILLVCVCVGCGRSVGSMEEETLDFAVVSKEIDDNIKNQTWHMDVLMDNMSQEDVTTSYGIDTNQVDDYLIRRSLLDASCDEILMFHVIGGDNEAVKQALSRYQQQRIEDADLNPELQTMLKQAQILEFGSYVVYVCGQESANVIQYISSLS